MTHRVVELRQYTLHPGRRDRLIALFDREFVETQEACGMRVVGQFRDLDAPDRFVWLRSFPDMPSRAAALAAFYDGPAWAAHRDDANATMVAWDDVRLLRPAGPGDAFPPPGGRRPPPGAEGDGPGLVAATLCHLGEVAPEDFAGTFRRGIRLALEAAGAAILGSYMTEPAPNTFPRLPVREDGRVFAWFAGFGDRAAHDRHVAALGAPEAMPREWLAGRWQRLRLVPTARSLLHGRPGHR